MKIMNHADRICSLVARGRGGRLLRAKDRSAAQSSRSGGNYLEPDGLADGRCSAMGIFLLRPILISSPPLGDSAQPVRGKPEASCLTPVGGERSPGVAVSLIFLSPSGGP